MSESEERLNQWLRDAHAMEEQAEQMLSTMASRIENYPELAARVQQHLRETESQRMRLETCMQRRDVSTSMMKDMAGKFSAMMQGVGSAMAGDEVMKGTLSGYTFEHFEICSYRILVAAAQAVGDTETARVCEEICREEEAMASWLADRIPETTRTYLMREDADMAGAKR